MKHLLSLFAASAMLSLPTMAADFEAESLAYNIMGDATVEVAGTADGVKFTKDDDVVVPQTVEHDGVAYTVTAIGEAAFKNCEAASFELPETLEAIADFAFQYNYNVTSIDVPDGVKTIGQFAYGNNNSALMINLGAGLEEIGESAFNYCTKAMTLTMGDNVRVIGASAFNNNKAIKKLTLSGALESIGDFAFAGCALLTKVDIPASVSHIGLCPFKWDVNNYDSQSKLTAIDVADGNQWYASIDGVVYNKDITTLITAPSAITKVDIPATVTELAPMAFYGCRQLASLELPEGLLTLGKECCSCTLLGSISLPGSLRNVTEKSFNNCNLTEITLGEGIETIGDYAFSTNYYLQTINYPSTLTTIGAHAFENCGFSNMWAGTVVGLPEIIIPDNVTTLGESAFANCVAAKTVTIGSGLTDLGDKAFSGLTSLESFTVSADNPDYASANGYLLDKSMTTAVQAPCALTAIDLPETVTKIGDWCFYNCNLKEMTLPESVTEIGDCAFYSCYNLTKASIPYKVVRIGSQAFFNVGQVKLFYSYPVVPPELGTDSFSGIKKSSCYLYVPEGTKDAYMAAAQWNSFAGIVENLPYVENPETAIQAVDDDSLQPAAEYYDLMGRRVANPEHGIFVKVQNGQVAKVAL